MAERYRVTELVAGEAGLPGDARVEPSLVIDTLVNRRVVATFRSEDYPGEPGRKGGVSRARRFALARLAAHRCAAELSRDDWRAS